MNPDLKPTVIGAAALIVNLFGVKMGLTPDQVSTVQSALIAALGFTAAAGKSGIPIQFTTTPPVGK